MSSRHWFVEAIVEMVDYAKAEGSKNTLCGLQTAFEVFLEEATITEEEKAVVRKMIHDNTEQPRDLIELELSEALKLLRGSNSSVSGLRSSISE